MRLTSLRICWARFPMGRFTLAMRFSAEWEIKCARLKMEHNVPNRISVQSLKGILSSPCTCSTVYYCPLWFFIRRTPRFRFMLKAFPCRRIEEALFFTSATCWYNDIIVHLGFETLVRKNPTFIFKGYARKIMSQMHWIPLEWMKCDRTHVGFSIYVD